ncbi:MFS transporter [Streptomyces erythrochromogenes]|uniref:MFS transporter n=1 Tax=Streptomyces erythrochromogenes TaxID=285574 RepID=UPI0034341139
MTAARHRSSTDRRNHHTARSTRPTPAQPTAPPRPSSHRRTPASPRATYRTVLNSRHVARLLAGTLTGRLPNAMVPVGLVLWITAADGSLAFAGLLAALYGLASALSQPIKGRLMDRHGQPLVSAPAVLVNSAGLTALTWIGPHGHPAAITTVVTLAGAFTPPLEAGLRALWPTVVTDPGQRRVVQALDTGSQGLIYIVGPLLATGLATWTGPHTALIAAAGLGLAGTTAVLTTGPSRAWRPATTGATAGSGHLNSRGLLRLFAALAGTGFALGSMNVWAAGMATTTGLTVLSGALPAAFATGSFLGGLIYARPSPHGTTTSTQLLASSALTLLGFLPLLAGPGPGTALALIVIPGLFLTLTVTDAFNAVDNLAPASRTTEAYAWLILSTGVGQAAGTALAGALANHPDAPSTLPACGAAATFAIVALAQRHLEPGRGPGRHRRAAAPTPRHRPGRERTSRGRKAGSTAAARLPDREFRPAEPPSPGQASSDQQSPLQVREPLHRARTGAVAG